jgi:hypothetical protein
MLSIDRIVEKYRSLGGAGGVAVTAEEADSFRRNLIAKPRVAQIGSYLWLFGSFERSLPLWEATLGEPADVFWPVFLENWSTSEGLWPLRQTILSTLRERAAQLSPIGFMEPSDRAFYDSLPDPVIVFRGCGRRRVRSLPWTTDREIAEFFARGSRFGPQRDPVIARAEIAKADLFFVSVDRKESEVILDPYMIKSVRLLFRKPAR